MNDNSSADLTDGPACPIPISEYPHVLMAHGGGGRLMHHLIESMFIAAFDNPCLKDRHDGALLDSSGGRLAFTTDSYVIRPLIFPGGDIGSLAVNGTVNDLAMCGARPAWLSAGFILEEGLSMETLWRVVQSMRRAADAAGVQIVTGDTKVVDRGKGDGMFINTSGIGMLQHEGTFAPASVQAGDAVLLNGDIGRHGMAVMAVREGLEFESAIESDCAPLAAPVLAMLEKGIEIHCLRDLTRGGLAGALLEISDSAGLGIHIDENNIPVRDDVRGACEILGLDPLFVANEGRFVTFVPEKEIDRALTVLQRQGKQSHSCLIGHVSDSRSGVSLAGRIGTTRVIHPISGEQLPRIC